MPSLSTAAPLPLCPAAGPSPVQLLDDFPLIRAHTVREAREQIGRIFSPHRLELRGPGQALDVHHNQVRMRDVSLNVLSYGAEVLIDPGERGDFYMVQLPLAGRAELTSGSHQVRVDAQVLSVLQPRTRSRMLWSGDCTMILVQVPRAVVDRRAQEWGQGPQPRFALSRPRHDPEVAAWWQAALDLTANLDRFGQQWLRHPAAYAAMEEFLLSAFMSLLAEPGEGDAVAAAQAVPAAAGGAGAARAEQRCFTRAKDYIHAHLDQALTLGEIARHACVSPRTLEAVFKRHGEPSPLAYARAQRLAAVHAALRNARHEGRSLNVTEVALAHGFVHMGRFAQQFRAQFGCAPSELLRPH